MRSHVLAIMNQVITVHRNYIPMITTHIPFLVVIRSLKCLHLFFHVVGTRFLTVIYSRELFQVWTIAYVLRSTKVGSNTSKLVLISILSWVISLTHWSTSFNVHISEVWAWRNEIKTKFTRLDKFCITNSSATTILSLNLLFSRHNGCLIIRVLRTTFALMLLLILAASIHLSYWIQNLILS